MINDYIITVWSNFVIEVSWVECLIFKIIIYLFVYIYTSNSVIMKKKLFRLNFAL